MDKGAILPFLCLFLALLFISGCTQTGQVTLPTPERKCVTEYYTETVCEDVPYYEQECKPVTHTETQCTQKNIAYKIEDWDVTNECLLFDEDCLQYTLGICTQKVRSCTKRQIYGRGTIYNLDNGSQGIFGITFYLANRTIKDLNKKTFFYSVYPQSNKTIGAGFLVTGNEAQDSENYYTYHVVTSPATKEVCEKVIKTKEECKTVTKYRRECEDVQRSKEVCD